MMVSGVSNFWQSSNSETRLNQCSAALLLCLAVVKIKQKFVPLPRYLTHFTSGQSFLFSTNGDIIIRKCRQALMDRTKSHISQSFFSKFIPCSHEF